MLYFLGVGLRGGSKQYHKMLHDYYRRDHDAGYKIVNFKCHIIATGLPPAELLKRVWPILVCFRLKKNQLFQKTKPRMNRVGIKFDVSAICGWETDPIPVNVTYSRKGTMIIECVGKICREKVCYGFQVFVELLSNIVNEATGRPYDMHFERMETENLVSVFKYDSALNRHFNRSECELQSGATRYDTKFPHTFIKLPRKGSNELKKCVVTESGMVNVAGLRDPSEIPYVQQKLAYVCSLLKVVRGVEDETFKWRSTGTARVSPTVLSHVSHDKRKFLNVTGSPRTRLFNVSEIEIDNKKKKNRQSVDESLRKQLAVYPTLSSYKQRYRVLRRIYSKAVADQMLGILPRQ